MIKFFFVLSKKYWMSHINRLMVLVCAVIIGATALCCSSLFIRSEKMAVLEEEFNICGNYDVAVYDVDVSFYKHLLDMEDIEAVGFYYENGYVVAHDNNKIIKTAIFANEESENIYHMNCYVGDYPDEADEIAVDLDTAKYMGINPSVGEKVTFDIYDEATDSYFASEYVVSGLFKSSDVEAYGGDVRFPDIFSEGEYDVPKVFFSYKSRTHDTDKVTFFIQSTADDIEQLKNKIFGMVNENGENIPYDKIYIPAGRTFVYSYILGISDTIYERYGSMDFTSIQAAINDGALIKDFYSAVLIPVFYILTITVVLVVLYGNVKNIINDRTNNLAIFRTQGLSLKSSILYLCADISTIVIIFALVGMGIGCMLHKFMITIVNKMWNTGLETAFNCSDYIKEVTANPYVMPVIAISLSSLLMVSMLCIVTSKKTITELINSDSYSRRKNIQSNIKNVNILQKIRFDSIAALVIVIVAMSISFFGYNYFRAYSDKSNIEIQNRIRMNGLSDYDFMASKSSDICSYTFGIENRHDAGIKTDIFEQIILECEAVDSYAMVVNNSTKLVYYDNAVVEEALAEYSLQPEYNIMYDDYDRTSYQAYLAMIKAIGYSENENIYSASTIGMRTCDISKLRDYVTDGVIDLEKIQSGKEVIVAVSKDEYQRFEEVFKAGNMLPLSDVILSPEEDAYDFSKFMPHEYLQPVYEEEFYYNETDSYVTVMSFALGKRHNIETSIGAVILLDEDNMILNGSDYSVVCDVSAFRRWGLPDDKYTNIAIKVSGNADMGEINAKWYKLLSDSNTLEIKTVYEAKMEMDSATDKIMSIFYIMNILLIIICILAISILVYNKIKSNSRNISIMYSLGMSKKQLIFIIMRKYWMYPVIGGVCSLIPTSLMQCLFYYIINKLDSCECF